VSTQDEELAGYLHAQICNYAFGGRSCRRWDLEGGQHRRHYEQRAAAIIAKLEPLVGIANVIPAVQAVVSELDL
jgi:hypothetical protein